MGRSYTLPALKEDPRKILGVSNDGGDKDIRVAYLEKIKEYPPDRCPEEFEQIRDAYETMRNPRIRTLAMLRSVDPQKPLPALLDNLRAERLFIGPKQWLAAMKER